MHALKNRHYPHKPPAGASRPVRSSQRDIHPRLDPVVLRHVRCRWRQPLHTPSLEAFQYLRELLAPSETIDLVLDSGCGNGMSTLHLAQRHAGQVVIGIDKSYARLRNMGAESLPQRRGNAVWLRAELATFWRLAQDAGWRITAHYLLYPNPWPKPRHLMRRWHAHPVFPALVELGGSLLLRSNWEIYTREFARAVRLASGRTAIVGTVSAAEPLSPFERKYAASGHTLYEVSVNLDK